MVKMPPARRLTALAPVLRPAQNLHSARSGSDKFLPCGGL